MWLDDMFNNLAFILIFIELKNKLMFFLISWFVSSRLNSKTVMHNHKTNGKNSADIFFRLALWEIQPLLNPFLWWLLRYVGNSIRIPEVLKFLSFVPVAL